MSNPLCPACRDTHAEELRRFTAEQSAQHFILREADPVRHEKLTAHLRSLWGGDQCAIMTCEGCGFGFAWPYVAGDSEFYELAYPSVGYTTNRWEFDRTIRELSQMDTKEARVLELGAGFGMFLDRLSELGIPSTNVSALEFHSASRAQLGEKGYAAESVDVRSPAFAPSRKFDLIFMFQVVEHMDRLDELMCKLRQICGDRAHLFISVPSRQRTNYFEEHGWQFDMPPAHIGRWTLEAAKQLASRHDFQIVSHDQEPFEGIAFLRNDLTSVYYRRAQMPGTLEHHARSLPRSRMRRWLEMAMVLSNAPRRLPQWLKAFQHRNELGAALWLHLQPIVT
jgi:2-polyprenyl-3-methyl-5-hydroxy-6-metoxy-1,4-benzoquinol methylase